MTDTLASSYDPKTFESRLYAEWEDAGYFKPSGRGQPYTVLLPPPNVTGTLHMGHAFQHTLQDALVRYHRMRGCDTLWQMGTDHAGIATEMVVARNLALEGKGETRDSLGREGFIEKIREWKARSGDTIDRQMRRLGASGDWSRSSFTMDPMASKAVIEAFVRLYEHKDENGDPDPLIYRGQRLVNWDPVLKTAISDLEVENVEQDGFLWSIRYDVIDPQPDEPDHVVVATTRPETMFGDSAVMVHPDDDRYSLLLANKRRIRLPLTGRSVPIIGDPYVDREFGTGAVKVTPAHDFNDYAVGQRHGLPLINIFTDAARIIDDKDWMARAARRRSNAVKETADMATDVGIPEKYWGLDRYEARKHILADLEAAGLLVETKPHKLQVPKGDRTGQVIEPYLTDQWFVRMDTLGARGLELAETGAVKFVPGNWINTYRHWMENIQDWCISRQLWWGHRIPAWWDDANNVYVGRDEAEVRAKHALGAGTALTQDSDVLETWFSSALWPFSTQGWPDEDAMRERGFDRYLPSSVLVTGFDIIFFWVARMIMLSDHFTGRVPFEEVYVTGLIRDKDGQKMSKSKGNVLDPLDIIDGIALDDLVAKRTTGLMKPTDAPKIEKATRGEFPDGIPAHGADALRFTIAALANHGRDIKFDMGRAEGYKNFCNKLWNATRFVLMNTEGAAFEGQPPAATDFEKSILAALARTADAAHAHFAAYRFDLLAQTLYEFAWNQFCDWFVELAKPALGGQDQAAAQSTRHTLLYVLESLLRLLHPLIPFITEALWRQVAPRAGVQGLSISLQPYPDLFDAQYLSDDYARFEADVEWFKALVASLRGVRSGLGVAPGRTVPLLACEGSERERELVQRYGGQLSFLLRLESIRWLDAADHAPASATAIHGELKLLVPLEGLVDLGAERARLDKELKRVEAEIAKCGGKLASETFVDNAPPAVVEQERKRLAEWNAQLEGLKAQRAKL